MTRLWSNFINGVTSRHVRIFGAGQNLVDVPVEVDPVNNALTVTDPVHMNTHKGRTYEVQLNGIQVASFASIAMLVRVDPGYSLHCREGHQSGGVSIAGLYEQPTVTAPGTPLNVINRNRRAFAPAARALVYGAPTTTADGTILAFGPSFLTGGTAIGTLSGESEGFNEWVLREGFDYMIRVINSDSANPQDLSMTLVFYEQKIV